ncbi:DUF4384 domain-containing protein [Sphingomonas sp. CJ20]
MNIWLTIPALMSAAAIGAASPVEGIGLNVAVDRPAGVYAVGDTISLTVSVARDAAVRVWLRDPSGKITPVIPARAEGEPIRVRAGERARLPRSGGLRITPPAGKYEFLVTATTDGGGDRSLTDADSRLAGRAVREQRSVSFKVEQI